MATEHTEEHLAEERRKEIFLALVEAQDKAMPVAQSRQLIMERFGITERQIRQIEDEGMVKGWPPL